MFCTVIESSTWKIRKNMWSRFLVFFFFKRVLLHDPVDILNLCVILFIQLSDFFIFEDEKQDPFVVLAASHYCVSVKLESNISVFLESECLYEIPIIVWHVCRFEVEMP